MKSLVVYFSKFGNTQLIAQAIAQALEPHGQTNLVSIDQFSVMDLQEAELIVFGCPTHRMSVPKELKPVLEDLPHHILHKTPAAVFDTSYQLSRWLAPFTASKRLAQRMRRLGAKVILSPETFHVVGREGPLVAGEMERAAAWTAAILKKLAAQAHLHNSNR